jgi:signal peptidase II
MKSVLKYFLFALVLIIIDQAIKLWVHNNMLPGYMGEIKVIGDVVKLHYVTNRGMAFGLELPFANGKLFLSIFRLIAMVLIGLYLNYLHKHDFHKGLLYAVAAILAGAIGNLIDSIFYGVALGNAPADAQSPWFNGQVVDMFFFDIYEGTLPDWIPGIGGTWYSTPIFNFADACIFCGVVAIMIFQNKFFAKPDNVLVGDVEDTENEEVSSASSNEITSEVEGEEISQIDSDLSPNEDIFEVPKSVDSQEVKLKSDDIEVSEETPNEIVETSKKSGNVEEN